MSTITFVTFTAVVGPLAGIILLFYLVIICVVLTEIRKRKRVASELTNKIEALEARVARGYTPEPYLEPISLEASVGLIETGREEQNDISGNEQSDVSSYIEMASNGGISQAGSIYREGAARMDSDGNEEDYQYDYIVVDCYDRVSTKRTNTVPNQSHIRVKLEKILPHIQRFHLENRMSYKSSYV